MKSRSRRSFVAALAGAPALAAAPGLALAESDAAEPSDVILHGDGLSLTPTEQGALLARLSAGLTADEYGLGGAVADCEAFFAKLLGKERAVFMPTGTLANHIALRTLARGRSRVLVQDISHVYNDTGDGCQVLSGLNLVPLAPGKATFTRADVEQVLARTASGRVAAEVGAISIESPVRRLRGELFDYQEMKVIAALAKDKGIGLHLDGARLFLATAFTGVSPADYAALFDTVYVSLWKYFNAPNGAILAGPAKLLDGLYHVRRMFGGALWSAWPFAVVARHYADGFLERFQKAVRVSRDFAQALRPPFRAEPIPGGSHLFWVKAPGVDIARLGDRLRAEHIDILAPSPGAPEGVILMGVNETWNRTTGQRLAGAFARAART